MSEALLPFRTDGPLLLRWLEARARDPLARPPGDDGAVATARALGLADREAGRLTADGERLVLAPAAARPGLVAAAMHRFEAYRAVMEAARTGAAGGVTEAGWIESWWGTQGYGSSRSNREEGVATLGRLADFAGLGRYIPGRRGHPTRIEWSRQPAAATGRAAGSPRATAALADAPEPRAPQVGTPPVSAPAAEVNRVAVPLSGGAVARLELPVRMRASDKERLLAVLQLLVMEVEAADGG